VILLFKLKVNFQLKGFVVVVFFFVFNSLYIWTLKFHSGDSINCELLDKMGCTVQVLYLMFFVFRFFCTVFVSLCHFRNLWILLIYLSCTLNFTLFAWSILNEELLKWFLQRFSFPRSHISNGPKFLFLFVNWHNSDHSWVQDRSNLIYCFSSRTTETDVSFDFALSLLVLNCFNILQVLQF
jgi:hypothetical protein